MIQIALVHAAVFRQAETPVMVNPLSGTKLAYRVTCDKSLWGADSNGKMFLMPRPAEKSELRLSVEVASARESRYLPTGAEFVLQNTVVEFSLGGRKAMANFRDGKEWRTWLDRSSFMNLANPSLSLKRTETEKATLLSILSLYGGAGFYLAQGRYIYSLPIMLQNPFYEKPWARADERYLCYQWKKVGDFAEVVLTKSKAVPLYGDPDFGKRLTYVTGKCRVNMKDGLMESGDVTIDDGHASYHIVSTRL